MLSESYSWSLRVIVRCYCRHCLGQINLQISPICLVDPPDLVHCHDGAWGPYVLQHEHFQYLGTIAWLFKSNHRNQITSGRNCHSVAAARGPAQSMAQTLFVVTDVSSPMGCEEHKIGILWNKASNTGAFQDTGGRPGPHARNDGSGTFCVRL
ncbi:hypothetical protein BS47DRAFT_1165227 [Hydnum rufescens UP504]|uniref:Uncharacterized protein n=1 Tax=Hydnum rufescens UP504 TaxID=1448309 RepID=A0A9P6ATQ3_9AGAM|nr:hypothetical protein BS47DRAFT_1165227 [Hydnum rufescens UP504]